MAFCVVGLCFLLSGFAALIYETAWSQQLSLVFGSSDLAIAAVLAAYMAGLAIGSAVMRMSRRRVGALLVFCRNFNLQGLVTGGVELDAHISQAIIESVFAKESPLHDGAMLIDNLKILTASVILPVSERTNLPKSVGLRHRAAIGITERTNVVSIVVSEETGAISFAKEDVLERKLSEERLMEILREYV